MLSIHLITDSCPPTLIDRALLFIGRTHPSHVVIGGGAAFDVTMQTVERARAISPSTRVILRKLEDTGVWTRLNPDQWFADRVAPIVAWCQQNRVIWLLDNESSGNDDTMRRYADWNVAVTTKLHAVGLNAAVCAFATGNIGESQYALLKPVYDAMKDGDVWASHEYQNAPGKSSAGHVFRYNLAWQAAGRALPTVITEAGIAVDYNPGHGFHTLGMSAADYVKYMAGFDKDWYQPHGVTICLFATGGYSWPTFQIGDDVFNELEKPPIAPPPAPAPTPIPPPTPPAEFDYGPMQAGHIGITKVNITSVNMRELPNIESRVVQILIPSDAILYSQNGNPTGQYKWHKVQHGATGKQGYVAETGNYTFVPDVVTTPPQVDNSARRKELIAQILALVDELEKLG